MSASTPTTATTTSRKRCELACVLCRRRKIKCLKTVPDRAACDKCVEKGREADCLYVPVADDHPPPPRQRPSPPANSTYSYAPMPPISPPHEYVAAHASSSSPQADYYASYPQYPTTPPASSSHYPQAQPVQMPLQTQHYGYDAPSSPTHHLASSPSAMGYSDNAGVSGMPMADGGVEMNTLPMMHWSGQTQTQYPINLPLPVAQNTMWTTSGQDQSEMSYYDPSYTQQPVQQYAQTSQLQHQTYQQYQNNGGSYYGSP